MMNKVQRFALTGLFAATALVALPARTEAVPFSFECITNTAQCEGIEAAFSTDVADTNQYNSAFGLEASFTFTNTAVGSLDTGTIAEIYFDDDNNLLFSSFVDIDNGAGVNFVTGASPPNLPGGNAPGINFTATDAFESPGANANGVDVGEWVRISFLLNSPSTLTSVINALSVGSLRVGMHVRSIGENSASYINNLNGTTTAPVPEPASLLLLGSGLAAAAGYARRRRAQKA